MLVRYGAQHPFSPPATTATTHNSHYRVYQHPLASTRSPTSLLMPPVSSCALLASCSAVRHGPPSRQLPRPRPLPRRAAASCPPRTVCWLAPIEALLRSGMSRAATLTPRASCSRMASSSAAVQRRLGTPLRRLLPLPPPLPPPTPPPPPLPLLTSYNVVQLVSPDVDKRGRLALDHRRIRRSWKQPCGCA